MLRRQRLQIIVNCKKLLLAYQQGQLGYCVMPEDSNPNDLFKNNEERLVYFTLPMSLNYQRDSYNLWKSVLTSYKDKGLKDLFSIKSSSLMPTEELRTKLLKYKIALQPNKHISTWQTISKTIYDNWGSLENLFKNVDNDFLKLKELVQIKHKKGFPYLSGPKIFNYWSFIISTYGKIPLRNREYIDIAPDTHITKCSVLLGIITEEESVKFSKDKVSALWREVLKDSGIDPIDMHPPLWFWSRNNFIYKL